MRNIGAHGQIMHGTCLCTDAEQYTSLSERMDPRELSALLRRYYEVVFEPVRRRGGIVSDVIGDSMMAIWTTTQPDAALRHEACLAALDIANSLTRLNESGHGVLLPTRIGLHSGILLLGNVGAMDHYEYRAVGDIVNTVTRIENLNKHLGTRILVSAEVLSGLDGFVTRDVGRFLLRGKSRPVAVHELLGREEEGEQELTRLCRLFAEGPAELRIANRPIVTLRADIYGAAAADRVLAIEERVDMVVAHGGPLAVTTQPIEGGIAVLVDGRLVFRLLDADVDAEGGETLGEATARAAQNLQNALDEIRETRDSSAMLRGVGVSLLATLVLAGLFWVLLKAYGWAARRHTDVANRRAARLTSLLGQQAAGHLGLARLVVAPVELFAVLVGLLLVYEWLGVIST